MKIYIQKIFSLYFYLFHYFNVYNTISVHSFIFVRAFYYFFQWGKSFN